MTDYGTDSTLLTGADLSGIGIELGIIYTDMRTPVVMLDCPDRSIESSMIRLLEAAQDGQRSFSGDVPTYFGDQKIQVLLTPATSPDQVLVDIYPLPPPGHLTVPFILRDLASRESLAVFEEAFEAAGHYHLLTGRRGRPSFKKMSLIKYAVGGIGRV
ncbi:MAG: hypothetical protein R6U70_01645 [Bacillota bacterium]